VRFGLYCADEYGCPVGAALWNSGPYETEWGWNYKVRGQTLKAASVPL
jgi:hypothetical protein